MDQFALDALWQINLATVRRSIAAVLHQEGEKLVHARELRSVENELPFVTTLNQARMCQFLQVERERRGRQLELLAYLPGRHAGLSCHDKKPVGGKTRWLCESGKSCNSLI